jgi:hypothetical protein
MYIFQYNYNYIKIPYEYPIMTNLAKGQNYQIWIFSFQSFCNAWMPIYKPFLNMNQINQDLVFIIYYLLEFHLSSYVLKKSIENLFEPFNPKSCYWTNWNLKLISWCCLDCIIMETKRKCPHVSIVWKV